MPFVVFGKKQHVYVMLPLEVFSYFERHYSGVLVV